MIAQRFDFVLPSTSLVVSDIEPYYFIPIDIVANYEVEVRGIVNEDIYTDYSNSCQFTATGIQYAISGVKDLNLIEGTGVSGYLAKFNGTDSITTGTLYYDVSNNLKFSELPSTTISENLYKLVIENDIVKKQLDTGSGTSLIEDFTFLTHGFTVGDVIRYVGTSNSFVKALADSAENAEVLGVVKSVNGNDFKVVIPEPRFFSSNNGKILIYSVLKFSIIPPFLHALIVASIIIVSSLAFHSLIFILKPPSAKN